MAAPLKATSSGDTQDQAQDKQSKSSSKPKDMQTFKPESFQIVSQPQPIEA